MFEESFMEKKKSHYQLKAKQKMDATNGKGISKSAEGLVLQQFCVVMKRKISQSHDQ